MKKYIITILSSLFLSYGFAQSLERSVIATGGNFSSTATMSLSFTIGEAVIATGTASSLELTQGFQQPSASTGGGGGNQSIDELSVGDFKVFPNPFQNEVQLTSSKEGNYTFQVVDVLGRALKVDYTTVNTDGTMKTRFDMATYRTGLYFLKIFDDSGHVSTIKIQKQ